ncbi:carbohydrate sulfotransferase [Elysia marginata]|uniref:Carbohydrate sulfotransferase n=1 Tax=Elysia marginata TaxID=1093978 RepID=A0AAV4IUI3_9GAST|nr:carbohydrate sulfotransferase [Elysia marginata]
MSLEASVNDPLQYPILFPFGTDGWRLQKLISDNYHYYKKNLTYRATMTGALLTPVANITRYACGRRKLLLCLVLTILVLLFIFGKQESARKKLSPKKTPLENHDYEETFRSRKRLYEKGCNNTTIPNTTMEIFSNGKHKLLYCAVPKTGCTFWKRLFRFLSGDVEDHVKIRSLYQIDRNYTHYGAWKDEVRGHYAINQAKKDYLKFEEFLVFSLRSLNDHWDPISKICNPCDFQPHLVARIETFKRDRDFILAKSHLSYLLKEKEKSHAETEIRSIVDYNYRLLYISKYKESYQACLTARHLARRLWYTFQLNGHIDGNSVFPKKQVTDAKLQSHHAAVAHVTRVFLDEIIKHPLTAEESHQQRQMAMSKAYRAIPHDVLMKLKAKYEQDFLLFGYNATSPAEPKYST